MLVTPRRIRSFAVVAMASLALVACGDDGGQDTSTEAQTFCGVVAPVQALAGISDKADDPATLATVFTEAKSALAAVVGAPPEDLAADLNTVKTTFDAANAALEPVDYSYEQAAAADPDALNALDDPSFTVATDNIQTWASKNCDGFGG